MGDDFDSVHMIKDVALKFATGGLYARQQGEYCGERNQCNSRDRLEPVAPRTHTSGL
jgi:hypothetical protein